MESASSWLGCAGAWLGHGVDSSSGALLTTQAGSGTGVATAVAGYCWAPVLGLSLGRLLPAGRRISLTKLVDGKPACQE